MLKEAGRDRAGGAFALSTARVQPRCAGPRLVVNQRSNCGCSETHRGGPVSGGAGAGAQSTSAAVAHLPNRAALKCNPKCCISPAFNIPLCPQSMHIT